MVRYARLPNPLAPELFQGVGLLLVRPPRTNDTELSRRIRAPCPRKLTRQIERGTALEAGDGHTKWDPGGARSAIGPTCTKRNRAPNLAGCRIPTEIIRATYRDGEEGAAWAREGGNSAERAGAKMPPITSKPYPPSRDRLHHPAYRLALFS